MNTYCAKIICDTQKKMQKDSKSGIGVFKN